MYGVYNEVLRHAMVWLGLVGLFALAILPDFVAKAINELYCDHTYRKYLTHHNKVRTLPLDRCLRLSFVPHSKTKAKILRFDRLFQLFVILLASVASRPSARLEVTSLHVTPGHRAFPGPLVPQLTIA